MSVEPPGSRGRRGSRPQATTRRRSRTVGRCWVCRPRPALGRRHCGPRPLTRSWFSLNLGLPPRETMSEDREVHDHEEVLKNRWARRPTRRVEARRPRRGRRWRARRRRLRCAGAGAAAHCSRAVRSGGGEAGTKPLRYYENTGSMQRTRAFVLHSSLAEGSCGRKYQSMPMRASSVPTSC